MNRVRLSLNLLLNAGSSYCPAARYLLVSLCTAEWGLGLLIILALNILSQKSRKIRQLKRMRLPVALRLVSHTCSLTMKSMFQQKNQRIRKKIIGTEILDKGYLNYGLIDRCSHYRRRGKIRAPCCNEIFDSRHCHNEAKNNICICLCT